MNKYLFSLMIIFSLSFILVGCNIGESIEEEVIEEKDPRENVLDNLDNKHIAIYNIDGLTSKDKKDSNMPYIYSISSSKELDGTYLPQGSENTCRYSVPYFNLNVEGIDKVNYIMKALCFLISYNENNIDSNTCNIRIRFNNDIMTVFLVHSNLLGRGPVSFNIDLTDKKVLTFDEMLNKLGMNKEEVLKDIKASCESVYNDKDMYIDVDDLNELYTKVISTIDNDNYLYIGKLDMNKKFIEYKEFKEDGLEAGGLNMNYGYNDENKFVIEYIYKANVGNDHTYGNITY